MAIECVFCNKLIIGPSGGSDFKNYKCNSCKSKSIDFVVDLLLNIKKSIENPWIKIGFDGVVSRDDSNEN